MTTRPNFFSSTVGTKVLIAASGLLLFIYLITHLLGNLMVFLGPETFNRYAHLLISNPLVPLIEIGLLLVFVLHVFKAVTNWLGNREKRPTSYMEKRRAGHTSRKSMASSTMILSGILILVFVVLHVRMFKYGTYYTVAAATGEVRDLYRLEVEAFSNPLNVAFYVAVMIFLGLHLRHGFWSAFQSLGQGPKASARMLALGKVLAVVIAGGFAIIPLWVFFFGGRS